MAVAAGVPCLRRFAADEPSPVQPNIPCGLRRMLTSFASRALSLGAIFPVIGKLLGHSDIETTARYVHLPKESLRETAERIAQSIASDIL